MGTNNYLMHYRTPGSLNGRTKYPGKYTPVGQLARGEEQTKQYPMPYVRRVNRKIDRKLNPKKYDADYQAMRKNRERDSRWTDNDYGGREYKDKNGNWKYEYYLRPEAKQKMFGESVKETLSDYGKGILNASTLGRVVLTTKKIANKMDAKTDKINETGSKNTTSSSKNGFRISSRTKQNEWTSYAEKQKQAAMARSSADARRKAAEKERLAENSRQRAILNNKKLTEQRRIAGGTAGTNINDYRAKQAERRSAEIAKQREESRTRNSRSAVGNAIADAKANRDVAKFIKNDIKDRIKRGKSKVKKLMSKWFG